LPGRLGTTELSWFGNEDRGIRKNPRNRERLLAERNTSPPPKNQVPGKSQGENKLWKKGGKGRGSRFRERQKKGGRRSRDRGKMKGSKGGVGGRGKGEGTGFVSNG